MLERKKVILKFGSKSLINSERELTESVKTIASVVDGLYSRGFFPIIVSSGAVRAGQSELVARSRDKCCHKIRAKPRNGRRYFSAVGQAKIVEDYNSMLRSMPNRLCAAQILVSRHTFANREAYASIANVIEQYSNDGIIPVINNNDFSYDEINDFSDNDQLAAFIGIMTNSTHVVMFSDVNGIYSANPHKYSGITPLQNISELTKVKADNSDISNGGIRSKIDSALILSEFGISHTVCTFDGIERLHRLLSENVRLGSTFFAAKSQKKSKLIHRWLQAGAVTKGIVVVSDKGTSAISTVSDRKSLLESGVEEVFGNFLAGDVVSIRSADFKPLATGITNYSSLRLLGGLKSQGRAEQSTSHRDAVVSANYCTLRFREYFQNSDHHLIMGYVSRYKKRFAAESDSGGTVAIFRLNSEYSDGRGAHHAKKERIASLDLDYWLSHKDALTERKKNLGLSQWSDFWIFKFAVEGDLLGRPHWTRSG